MKNLRQSNECAARLSHYILGGRPGHAIYFHKYLHSPAGDMFHFLRGKLLHIPPREVIFSGLNSVRFLVNPPEYVRVLLSRCRVREGPK